MRIFKIGTTEIEESESLIHLTNDEYRQKLAASYPEVTNATMRETKRGDDTLVEFVPVAGRKG